jgi:hypothetical protein
MAEERERWYRRRAPTLIGPIWFIGWLFTIGYAGLVWWEILLANSVQCFTITTF